MSFGILTGFKDLIDEPSEPLTAIVKRLPTFAGLVTIAALSALIDDRKSQNNILSFALRRLPNKLKSVSKKVQIFRSINAGTVFTFTQYHLNKLAILFLQESNDKKIDFTPEEDWLFFKAYLKLVSNLIDQQELKFQEIEASKNVKFYDWAWGPFAEEYQFNRRPTNINDLIKSVLLIDELYKRGYHKELDHYSTLIGFPLLNYCKFKLISGAKA